MDIGYTDLPREVLDQHLGYLDCALKLCREHDNFHWTIESAYLVRDYLRNRPEKCQNELIRALKNGKMELQAFETQPLTELLSAAELLSCVEYACNLGKKHGFTVKSAMINDIGGYAGRLPTVLEHYDVKYLTAGVGGFQVHLPWAGLPHLFYLKAKDGARTLIWNLGINRSLMPQDMESLYAVYGQAALCLILPAIKEYLDIYERGVEIDFKTDEGGELDTEGVFAGFLKRLKQEKYPFEEIMLQYGGDNRGPAPFLPELIQKLNASGKFPEIELTPPTKFFEYMERKYKDKIPEIEGIITDPWNMRANPAPVPLKNYQSAQRIYSSALSRLALSNMNEDEYLKRLCCTADNNLKLYGDHTCGLSEWAWMNDLSPDGCRGQAYDRYRESWRAKAFYAAAAKDAAIEIDRIIKNRLSASNGQPAIIIWNNSEHTVSGSTTVYLGRDAFPLRELKDRNGNKISFQEIAFNRYLIAVEEIPPFGAKAFYPVFADRPEDFICKSEKAPQNFENNYFKVVFTANGNLTSIQDKLSGAELLDQNSKWSFGEFIVQRIDDLPQGGKSAGMTISRKSCYPKAEIIENSLTENGLLTAAFTQNGEITTDAGTIRYQRTLRFYHNSPRIDVKIRLDKPETEKKESCYVAFPFAGTNGEFKFDQNIGFVDPGKDLLPGAMLDLFYCSRFCAVETDNFSAVIATPDAPLVQFGGIQTAQWLQKISFRPQNNHIFGQIYHNLLNTDCPIWQDVLDTFEYSVLFYPGKFDYSSVQGDINNATALSANFCNGEASDNTNLDSLKISPQSIRLISIGRKNNKCQLIIENPNPEIIITRITYNNKTHNFSIGVFEIACIEIDTVQ
jgi:hypothetical protein